MKKILKSRKAITLIALVITIVVLVILAVVTISLTVGNDGLIARAIKAANGYRDAQERDKQSINDLYGQLVVATDGTVTMDSETLKTIIQEEITTVTKDMQDTIDEQETKIISLQTKVTTLERRLRSGTVSFGNMAKYSSASTNVTFSQPLTNNNYNVTVTTTSSEPYWSYIVYTVINKTVNGFTIIACNNASEAAAGVTANWTLINN